MWRMKGKAWTREITMRPAIKRGWNGNRRVRIQAEPWKFKTLRNEGFARPNKPAPVINAFLNGIQVASLHRSVSRVYTHIHTRTYALITVMELRIELSPDHLNIFARFRFERELSLNGSEISRFFAWGIIINNRRKNEQCRSLSSRNKISLKIIET